MSTLSYAIQSLLETMNSPDKDFRFMACNDLMGELQKDSITLDDDTERKVAKTLLRLLEDKNGEVQNLAVRCLAPLVHKIKLQQLDTVVDTLCSNLESNNERLRDVSSIALKTVMAELPGGASSSSINCVKRVLPRLTEGLCSDSKTDASVKLEILDLLSTLIARFGRCFSLNFDDLEKAIFLQFGKDRQALRKRAIHALGCLVDVVPNDQFDRIVKRILAGCEEHERSILNLRTYVSATTAVCRASPARFSHFLPEFISKLIAYSQQGEDDELKEACIQALENFIYRCSKPMAPFIPQVVAIVSDALKFDPNYHYDDDTDNDESSPMETEDEDGVENNSDGEEAEEYSDDDDLSWKVRRAAAKCIEALVSYQGERLADHYTQLGPLLISQFKDREEGVKHDIFHSYGSLLKQTRLMLPEAVSSATTNTSSNATANGHSTTPAPASYCQAVEAFRRFVAEELSADQRRVFEVLEAQTPSLVKAIHVQLRGKNPKTRQQCFILLTHLLRALPGALSSATLQSLIPPVKATLSDKTADGNIKITALHFLTVAFTTHSPQTLYPLMGALVPLAVGAVRDPFYKVTAEGLAVAQALIGALRPSDAHFDSAPHVAALYGAIGEKLLLADIDQEVKEKTITAAALLVALFADHAAVRLSECLPLLLERLRNEITRQVTVRAFTTIVRSHLRNIDLSGVLPEMLPLLAEFLRKNQRTLRITTLTLLEALVVRYAQGGLENGGLVRVVKEVPALISEQDLQIAHLSLKFITDVIVAYPDQIAGALPSLFNALVALTQSSLLQGSTLAAALQLFSSLVRSPLPNKPTFEEILDRLSAPAYSAAKGRLLHRQTYISIGKSIAEVARASGDLKKATQLVQKLKEVLTSADGSGNGQGDSVQLFALLTLGELGRLYSAVYDSPKSGGSPEQLLIKAFASPLEELKTAASYSLGSLTVGNLRKHLPFLLSEINANPKRQQYLLHALKEVISSESGGQPDETFLSGVGQIWGVLLDHADCPEEGTRSIVAECMGRLCLVDAPTFLPQLLNCARHSSARVRATAVTAVRFMITDHPMPVDELLRPVMGEFLQTVRDEDLLVRRTAIVTLNSAAHNKPKLIKDCLQSLLPALYSETTVKEELVHEVEMGPFKHLIDDGLDLRKSSFECMYTLAEQCLDRIDVSEYLSHVEKGLQDQHDIKLLTFLMIIRLSSKCPTQIVQKLDRFCELIKPQLLLRPKQNAVKQDNDKQDELKRSAVRAVLVLHRIPSHDRSQKMSELIEIIRGNPDLATTLEMYERDHAGRFSIDVAMDTE